MRMPTLLAVAFAPITAIACDESIAAPVVDPAPLPSTPDATASDSSDAAVADGGILDGGSVVDADAAPSCGGGLVDDFESAWASPLRWDGTFDTGTGTSAPGAGHASAHGARFTTAHFDDAAGLFRNVSGACPLSVQAMINLVSGGNNDDLVVLALDLVDGRSLGVKLVRGPVTKATLALSYEQSEATSDKAFPLKQWTKMVLDYVPSTGTARVTVGDEVWATLAAAPTAVSKVRIGVISCANTSEGAEPNELLLDDVTIQL